MTAARLKGGFGVLAPGANLHVITNPWTKRQMPGTGVRRGYGERLSFTLDFTQCRTATVHGPYIMSQCDVLYEDTAARPSKPTPRGAAPRRRSPPRSHRRIRLLTAARLTAAARPTTTKLRGSQRITRKRTSCPRDGPQPSSAAACEAGRAVLGLTLRSSR